MSEWQVAAEAGTPGWIEVPPSDEGTNGSWIAGATAEVEDFWQGAWSPAVRAEVENLLIEAGRSRSPAEALSLVYWPVRVPAVIGVRVRVVPTVPLDLWTDADFDVVRYDGAQIGSGAQCIKSAVITDESGKAIRFVTANWVFSQGPESVVISVDPTPVEWFMHMIDSLDGLIQSLELSRPDGTRFAGRPFAGLARIDIENWESLDDLA